MPFPSSHVWCDDCHVEQATDLLWSYYGIHVSCRVCGRYMYTIN